MAGDTIDLSAKDKFCQHLASADFSPWWRVYGRILLKSYGCTVEVLKTQWVGSKRGRAKAFCPLSAFHFPTPLLSHSPLLPQLCVTLPPLLLFCPAGLLILNVDAPARLLGTLQAQERVQTHTHTDTNTQVTSLTEQIKVFGAFSVK